MEIRRKEGREGGKEEGVGRVPKSSSLSRSSSS